MGRGICGLSSGSNSWRAFMIASNRLRNLGCGVRIPIVLLAVPNENATQTFDGVDEAGWLHAIIRSSTLRIPGSSPLEIRMSILQVFLQIFNGFTLGPIIGIILKITDPCVALLLADKFHNLHRAP